MSCADCLAFRFLAIALTRSGAIDIARDSELGTATTLVEATREPAKTLDPAPSPRGKVLVIDDEVAVGRVMTRALGTLHETVTLMSGREALARIAAGERFDAILCDVRMPDISGLDVHRRLMALAPDQANRIIFMTGDGLPGAGWAALDRLGRPILEKPFPIQLVRLLVAKQIGRK